MVSFGSIRVIQPHDSDYHLFGSQIGLHVSLSVTQVSFWSFHELLRFSTYKTALIIFVLPPPKPDLPPSSNIFTDITTIRSVFQSKNYYHLFFFFWLCWVFVAVHRLSPVAASGDHSSLPYAGFLFHGFPCCGAWAPGAQASVVAAHGLSN